MSAELHLDRDALRELKAVMGSDFNLLIETFFKDSAMRIDSVRAAAAAADPAALRRAAHSFKGSSGNMGAPALAELCRQLEDMGRDGSTAGSEPLIEALAAEYAAVQRELEQFLK